MPYTIIEQQYLQEETERIRRYYNTNRNGKLVHFDNYEQFSDWYFNQLHNQQLRCHYCNISILSIRQLLNANLIQGRLVRGESYRGPNFELDRMNPNEPYSVVNCVLSCYYCNNDKSNTFTYDVYHRLIGPAKGVAMSSLLREINNV